MAKTIAAYKGIWKQTPPAAEAAVSVEAPASRSPIVPASHESMHLRSAFADDEPTSPSLAVQAVLLAETNAAAQAVADAIASVLATEQKPVTPVNHAASSTKAESSHKPSPSGETPAFLEHRYRMLVLKEHQHRLGRDLLEAGHRDPWQLAWATVTSLGQSFRPWAHARIFALGCYLGVEMSPEILRQLRHPLWFRRYRRSMFGLWRLLEILVQKTGQKPLSRLMFRLFYLCPPLAILIYEKQLQAVLQKAQGTSPSPAAAFANATQGQ